MVRSTQIDSNEIQLDDILKDEEMEVRTAWEDNNLATLEVMEEGLGGNLFWPVASRGLSFLKNPALVGLVVQQPTLREPYWSLPISSVLNGYNGP
jgi:hypothetical protein